MKHEPPHCPHIDTCEMYALFRLAGSLKVWKVNYCTADYQRCARWQEARHGRPIAPTLLPNGQTLKLAGQQPATAVTGHKTTGALPIQPETRPPADRATTKP